jgi:hypothetical protein
MDNIMRSCGIEFLNQEFEFYFFDNEVSKRDLTTICNDFLNNTIGMIIF